MKITEVKKFIMSALVAPLFAVGWVAGVVAEFVALQHAALLLGFARGRGSKKGGE